MDQGPSPQKQLDNLKEQILPSKDSDGELKIPPFYFTIPLRSGFGAFTGFFAGMFAKELTRTLVFYLGLGISTIALLNYYKYITINWKKIDEDLFNFVTKKRTRKDVNRLTEYVKRFFTHVLPISAGFFGAFYYAFKYS